MEVTSSYLLNIRGSFSVSESCVKSCREPTLWLRSQKMKKGGRSWLTSTVEKKIILAESKSYFQDG